MKIAIFVDGKNFYMGCQRYAAGRRLPGLVKRRAFPAHAGMNRIRIG